VAHAAIGREMGVDPAGIFVLEDGQVLELTPFGGKVSGKVPAGHIYVDGQTLMDANTPVLRDRRALARDGIVVVVVPWNRETGKMPRAAEIVSSGFLDPGDTPELFRKVSDSVSKSLEHLANDSVEWSTISSIAKDTVARVVRNEAGRNPVVLAVPLEV
jgi:ribonuclease J